MKRICIVLLALVIPFSGLYARGKSESTVHVSRDRSGRSETAIETYNLDADQEIRINLRTGGEVRVSGGQTETAKIKITRWGSAIDEAVVDIDETSRGINILAYYQENTKNSRAVDLDITAPDATSLHIETLGGDIEIRRSTLSGRVNTLGGDIELFEVTGDLDSSTLGGKVVYHDSSIPGGSDPVKIDTMGGDIDISEALSGIKATTLGGDIVVTKAAVFVDANTLGGDIEIGEVDGWVRAKTLGGRVSVTMIGDSADGKRDATLSSLGGDVVLTVPASLDMDIEIILEESKDAKRDYSIISDFDITIEEKETSGRGDKKDIRTVTMGRGTTGEGTHRITLSTINGDIYLKKGR